MTTTKATTTASTTAEPPSTAPTAQPLLDLTRLMLAIRRRRRFWVGMSLVGLLAGISLALLVPTPPTAIVRVLVVHEDDQPSDTGNLVRTDVALLDTAKIAGEALEKIGSRQRPEDFLQDYDVLGMTNNVLEVTVRAKTNADAVKRAKALAEVFIADHVGRIKAAADSEAKALTDQRDRVQAELKQVNNQIATAEDKAKQGQNNGLGADANKSQPNAAGLDSLYARRAELTSRVSDLSQQAEEASIGAPRVAAGTQIVDDARPLKISPITTLATNAGLGLLLGLVIGWALAAITGVVRDKPVLRRDISANLGASVIAQLTAPRRGLARLWRRSRRTQERRRVAGTLVRLVRGGGRPVSILELGSRRIAAALALDVASRVATDRDVVIVEDPAGRVIADDLPGRDLDELTRRADRPIRIIGADQTGPATLGEIRIGIGSVTPGTPWTDLGHLGGETLLVVRTGFANTAWLHTVARQLADARIPIIGIVLVDPDPRDKSDGTLWDALHTALRGRGRPATTVEVAPEPAMPESAAGSTTEQTPWHAPKSLPERKPSWAPEPVAKPAAEPTQKPLPERRPSWVPEPAKSITPAAEQAPESEPVSGPVTVRVAQLAESAGEPVTVRVAQPAGNSGGEPEPAAKPEPEHYPAPVPANGANADLPTKRFASVPPYPRNENGNGNGAEADQDRVAPSAEQSVHDLPTKRFAPVRPEDAEDLVHRRIKS